MEPKLTTLLNGTKEWRLNGEFHREDGPAVEWLDGSKFWYINGKRHRENGPAIEWPIGLREWFLNGKRHREDGPAIEWPAGTKFWYLNDRQLFEKELLSEKIKIDYPEIYNSYLVYQIMGS